MKRCTLVLCFGRFGLALIMSGRSEDLPVGPLPSSPPLWPAEEGRSLRLPPGVDAELVASEPDIAKPLNLAVDDHGRLWVTDTLEYPYPAKLGTKARDSVKILEDFGPHGKARKITTFADGLN